MFRQKLYSKRWIRDYFLVFQGAVITAFGYAFFLIPNKIIPGGLFGIATTLYYLFSLPAGTVVLLLNIPLILLSVKILGPRFGIKTVVGMSLVSILTDFFSTVWHGKALTDDILTGTLVGSFLVGAGISFIFKGKGTTGGTDIIGQILYKKWRIPVGKTLLILNISIIGIGGIVLWNQSKHIDLFALYIYSFMGSYAVSKVLDVMLDGFAYYKGLFVISDEYEEIKKAITERVHRGGTIIPAKGIFSDAERRIIFTTMTRRETAYFREIIKDIDPKAFVVVFQTNEVLGSGFIPLQDKD